jgi:hypothetical protein
MKEHSIICDTVIYGASGKCDCGIDINPVSEYELLKQENERLRKALEPFASAWKFELSMSSQDPSNPECDTDSCNTVKPRAFRKAYEALQGKGE